MANVSEVTESSIDTEANSQSELQAAYTSTVTLTPTESDDFKFDGWYSDAEYTQKITEDVDEDGKYTYTVDGDKTVYAKFSGEAEVYAQSVDVDNGGSVTAKFNGIEKALPFSATEGTKVTLAAFSNVGYQFDGWYENNTLVSTDVNYKYTITSEKTLRAKFSAKSDTSLAQQALVAGSGGTAAVSANSVSLDTNVTFTATPDTNYEFVGWYSKSDCDGMAISTDKIFTLKAKTANTLYAKFSAINADGSPSDTNSKNNGRRNTPANQLSDQAKDYYQREALSVDTYKNADGGVYQTFVNLADAEANDSANSFDVIYKNGSGGYDKDNSKSDDAEKYKYKINNSLYGALYDIMSSTHTHGVSYPAYSKNALASYWLTTDTSSVNAADGRGVYTMFYSDENCHNHKDMQREHIWPKSKASFLMKTGLGGSDLHHLRPAYGKLNLLKLNWGFASIKNDNTWKNTKILEYPSGTNALWRAEKNKETFIDVKDDVRGDVARILLYIYTRWREPNLYSDIVDSDGNPDTSKLPELDPDDSKDTGERIIYNLDTLLDWMKNDPVSEWEMKRNDLTQDIQGNRNVFIDYPELAWLIFDKKNDLPSMDTPSGMANNGTDIEKQSDDAREYSDMITLDFGQLDTGNGAADITAYDNTIGKAVKNGDTVDRGDVITYTITPDQSEIVNVIEFSSAGNGTSNADRITTPVNSTGSYSFTKQAGYFGNSPNVTYKKDRIRTTLHSSVCELSYKVNSLTKDGTNPGGSGTGMVLAQYAAAIDGHKKSEIINSGDTVPNGASITFTFTPDYGSRFVRMSSSNSVDIPTPTKITDDGSYQTTVSVTSEVITEKDGKTVISYTKRLKKFTAYFAQTFNALDKVTVDGVEEKAHINNKGMRPDEADNWKNETDFTTNFEICGVQIKKFSEGNENKALRFVSVIDKNILDKAESYGYVIGRTTHSGLGSIFINSNSYTLVKDGANALTVPCTDTDNTVFGDYGKHDTTTNYKYITAAIENIPDSDVNTTIIARPYVVLKGDYVGENAPKVIYGQYVNFSTGENYCSISTSYNHIYEMANTNKEEE
ncbi:MAG: endonuclease [Ruminococcus sp.]|nr:endonuclease [Ruminococcus sp.]